MDTVAKGQNIVPDQHVQGGGGCDGSCAFVKKLRARMVNLEETVMQHAIDKGDRESRIRALEDALMEAQNRAREDIVDSMTDPNRNGDNGANSGIGGYNDSCQKESHRAHDVAWDPSFRIREEEIPDLLIGDWRVYVRESPEPSFSYGLVIEDYDETSMTFRGGSHDGVSYSVSEATLSLMHDPSYSGSLLS